MIDPSGPVAAAQNSNDYQPQWSTWARRVAILGLLIAAVYAITLLAPVMQLLSATLLLSLAMSVPSRLFARYLHVSHGLAVTLSYGLVILLLGAALAVIVPTSVDAARSLSRDAEQRFNQLQRILRDYTPDQGVVTVLGIQVDIRSVIDPVRNAALGTDQNPSRETTPINAGDLRQWVATTTETLALVIAGISAFVSTSLLALFISFLVLLDVPNLERALREWIPAAYQRESALLIHQVGSVWNGFFRGQMLIAFIITILTWLQLTVMGVQNAVPVALFGGFISLIPTIGGVIALVPIAIVSLLQGSTVFSGLSNGTFAILVVVVNLALTQIIWNVVAPKIMGDAVNLPLPVIIVGVFIGVALGGVLGAFLITPILGTVRVITGYLLRKIARQDPFPGLELSVTKPAARHEDAYIVQGP